jgi:hypothetical protein
MSVAVGADLGADYLEHCSGVCLGGPSGVLVLVLVLVVVVVVVVSIARTA